MTVTGYEPLDTLKPVVEGLWLIDSAPTREARLPLPTRATLVQLTGGDLWLHAPTRLTKQLREEIDELGPLAHIVAPAPTHVARLPDWLASYPDARFWAVDGVVERAAKNGLELPKPLALGGEDAERAWGVDLHQSLVQGNPAHSEAVFFHRASDTLILTDLISAIETVHLSPWMRPVVWLSGLDDAVGRMPRWLRRGFRDEQALADSVERMIGWGPRRIILSHGRWYRRDGVGELERAFHKVLRERQWETALQRMKEDSS